jgi:hypothetical protein
VSTPGLVYFEVSAAAMKRLDAYEDDFYVRVPVTVEVEGGGEMEAEVYLMAREYRYMVLEETWESTKHQDPSTKETKH